MRIALYTVLCFIVIAYKNHGVVSMHIVDTSRDKRTQINATMVSKLCNKPVSRRMCRDRVCRTSWTTLQINEYSVRDEIKEHAPVLIV